MSLSREQILAADDIAKEPVQVPEWGDDVVIVKGMTGTERDEFEQSMRRNGELDLRNARAKMLVRVIVNEGGNRIFTDADAPSLGKKSGAILGRLYETAAKLSGLGEEEEAEIEGNSDAATTRGESGSPSPETSDAPSLNS
jgi:hypothetical protein